MACRMASSSTSSPNGLVKNSTAPAFIAWTDIGTSPWPVMKMIGMSVRSTTRFWRSSPLRSGRVTSSTRQLGTSTRGRERNSCADANVSGCQPAQRISSSNDSRTDISSSTTKTTGVASDIGASRDSPLRALGEFMSLPQRPKSVANHLPHPERGIDRVQQRRLAEWLAQALHGTLFEHAWTNGPISVTGNEDDRNLLPAKLQFSLEIGPGHARHGDVEDQTPGLADATGREKLLRRRERLGRKAAFPQQVGERLAHRLVVIDDRHE